MMLQFLLAAVLMVNLAGSQGIDPDTIPKATRGKHGDQPEIVLALIPHNRAVVRSADVFMPAYLSLDSRWPWNSRFQYL